jgi:hypothetical protein
VRKIKASGMFSRKFAWQRLHNFYRHGFHFVEGREMGGGIWGRETNDVSSNREGLEPVAESGLSPMNFSVFMRSETMREERRRVLLPLGGIWRKLRTYAVILGQ